MKKTIISFRLRFRPEKGKGVQTYHRTAKRRIIIKLEACPRGEFDVLVRYADRRVNQLAWYKTKRELIHAVNAFTERSLLEEFLSPLQQRLASRGG